MADKAAHLLITVGGVGTILSVLGVCLFLVWVVWPLFLPSRMEPLADLPAGESPDLPLQIGMDEHQLMGWSLFPDGEVVAYRLDNGQVRQRLRPFGTQAPVAWSFPAGVEQAAFGFADGTVQLGSIGFTTTFVPGEQVAAADLARLEAGGDVINLRNGVAGYTPEGQVRLQELRVALEPPVQATPGPVHRVSMVNRASGPFLAVLSRGEDGDSLWVLEGREEEDFMTGASTVAFTPPLAMPLPGAEYGAPDFLALNGRGSDVFLAWHNGFLARVHCGEPEDPFIAEEGWLTPEGADLTAMRFILGQGTLLWADREGHLAGGFLLPSDAAAGVRMRAARSHPQRAEKALAVTKDLGTFDQAATLLAPSGRSRIVAAGFADGAIRLFNVTSQRLLAEIPGGSGHGSHLLVMAPKEDGLLALGTAGARHWSLDPRYPEAGVAALFLPVWYEGYDEPRHVWQSSSGTDDFEAKLGLMPLIFGTIKATFYSMLFGAPLALLAAIFTSEFMNRKTRALVKPAVEMMASLPSVVLGFLAALVFAPLVESALSAILALFVTVPLAFLLGAYLWQMMPVSRTLRLARWRFPCQAAALVPGVLTALWAGPAMERLLFPGSLQQWLAWTDDGAAAGTVSPQASPFGGWVLLVLAPCAITAAVVIAKVVTPRLRTAGFGWSRRRLALADLAKFLGGGVLTVVLTAAVAALISAAGFDPRGGLMDTYVQRNALVVGFVMGFAIIPIIYTIAEDALSTIPEHLRSASLGAGATQWQTAMRIVIPTAMSGLFSALMIGLGRAVGETMVVLMAAGNTPVMSWNVFEGFRTLSANIAVELPEAVRNSTHYRTLFLAALVLFAMTFLVNTVAEVVRLRFRRRSYQL